MSIIKSMRISILLLLLSAPVLSAGDLLDRCIGFYRGVSSVQARFVQYKYLSIMESVQKGYGRFYFRKRGRKLAWITDRPHRYRMVVRGDTVIKEYPGLGRKQKLALSSVPQIRALFENLYLVMGLTGRAAIRKNYTVRIVGPRVILIPRSVAFRRYIVRIDLVFYSGRIIREIKIHEPGGDYTRFVFHGVKLNKRFPSAVFSG